MKKKKSKFRERSSLLYDFNTDELTCAWGKKKTKPDPRAVKPHVKSVPNKAWIEGETFSIIFICVPYSNCLPILIL